MDHTCQKKKKKPTIYVTDKCDRQMSHDKDNPTMYTHILRFYGYNKDYLYRIYL